MWRAMLRATSTAPRLRAANGETCAYSVPMSARSASFRLGQLIAPGTRSSANSLSERASMTAPNSARRTRASDALTLTTGIERAAAMG
jgi:hypothetical protein